MNIPLTKALTAFAAVVLLNPSAQAAMLSETSTAPATSVLSQPDFSGGAHSNADYSNQNTPGQTFTPTTSFTLNSLTIKGAGSNNSDNGDGNFYIQIGSVSGTTITALDTETAAIVNVPSSTTDYLTFTLTNTVPLTAGTVYSFSIFTRANNFYFGFANSNTDVYSGGTSFDLSTNGSGTGTFSNTIASTQGYDRTFYLGGVSAAPEPSTVALSILAAGAFFFVLRRRVVANR